MPAKTERQQAFTPLPREVAREIMERLRDGIDSDQSAIRVGLITDALVERLFEARRRAREHDAGAALDAP